MPHSLMHSLSCSTEGRTYEQICPETDVNCDVGAYACTSMQLATELKEKSEALS